MGGTVGNMDSWSTIHAERKALAADLEGLDQDQWSTVSLCSGWTVQEVVAHMTATAKMTPPSFFASLVGSGFRFERVQKKGISAETGSSPADTLARFQSVETSMKHPPCPTDTMLGETIVHCLDIRWSLGIDHY